MNAEKFILKEPNTTGSTLIYLIHRSNNNRFKYSIGESVSPLHWNAKEQRANDSQKELSKELRNDLQLLNATLSDYKREFKKLLNKFELENREIDYAFIKSYLDLTFNRSTAQPKVAIDNLCVFIDEFIKDCEFTKGTIKTYVYVNNVLKEYQTKHKSPLKFELITPSFYSNLTKYLQAKNLSKNNIGKIFKNVKKFMQLAYDRELHTNLMFKKFHVVSEDIENIYLTEDEVQRIAALDLTQSKRLDNVRDLFLIGCRTGLRFSDLITLSKNHFIEGFTQIAIKTQKTGETVYIPIHPQTREILEKHNYDLPRKLSNQKFNNYIKELCKLANIDEAVTIAKTKGGQKEENTKPKYEFATVHTARRTFATLMFKAGFPSISIMKITGHRTERAFLKYIKITGQENAAMMLNHEYFSPLKKVV